MDLEIRSLDGSVTKIGPVTFETTVEELRDKLRAQDHDRRFEGDFDLVSKGVRLLPTSSVGDLYPHPKIHVIEGLASRRRIPDTTTADLFDVKSTHPTVREKTTTKTHSKPTNNNTSCKMAAQDQGLALEQISILEDILEEVRLLRCLFERKEKRRTRQFFSASFPQSL